MVLTGRDVHNAIFGPVQTRDLSALITRDSDHDGYTNKLVVAGVLLAAVLLLASGSTAHAQDGFDRIWARHGEMLRSQGVDERHARAILLWSELQVHLGQCRGHLSESNVTHWRDWWNDKPIARTQFGHYVINDIGKDLYTQGLEMALTEPLTGDHCQRVLDSWIADMTRLMGEYTIAQAD